jgi:LPXTG-motif cell wall-anchored protein
VNTYSTTPRRALLRWALAIPVAMLGLLAVTWTAQAAEPGSGYGPPAPGGGTLSFPTVLTAMTIGPDGGALHASIGCTDYSITIPPGFLGGGAQVVLSEAVKEQAQQTLSASWSGYQVAQAVQISRQPAASAASDSTIAPPPGLRNGSPAVRAAAIAPDSPRVRITGCSLNAAGTELLVWAGNVQRVVAPSNGRATVALEEPVTSVLILVPSTTVLGTSRVQAAPTTSTVAGVGSQGPPSELSYTGTDVTSLLPIGAGGLLAGAAMVMLVRRRRKAE